MKKLVDTHTIIGSKHTVSMPDLNNINLRTIASFLTGPSEINNDQFILILHHIL